MATATKKAAKAAPAAGLMGYCMKTKQKEPMLNATIENKNGRYIGKGESPEGHKITVIMSAEQAQTAIDNDWATLVEEAPAKAAKKTAPAKKK